MSPIVNFQYGMANEYTPWDQPMGFDVNAQLMAVPNLMMDTSYPLSLAPMAPSCASPYREPSPQEVYQPPVPSQPLVPASPPVASPPVTPPRTSAPPPMTSLPPRSPDGPQIRLNPLVMKPNLSRSLPVTTPFKK